MPQTTATLVDQLPDDARQRLAEMAPHGLQTFAFTPAGGWVIVGTPTARDAGYAARGIPDACFVQIGEFVRAGYRIRSVAFAPADRGGWGGWVVVSDQGYAAAGIPQDCFAAIGDLWALGLPPSCVAFTVDDDGQGDAGWLVLAGRELRSRGIDWRLRQRLDNLAQGMRPARQVAFVPGGGWVVLAQERFIADGVADGCRAHLAQVAQRHVVEQLAFTPGGGWCVHSETLAPDWPADPLREAEDRFRLVNGRWRSLAERMAAQQVAGVGIALLKDGALASLTTYGAVDEDQQRLLGEELRSAAAVEADVHTAFDDGPARITVRVFAQQRAGFASFVRHGGTTAMSDEIAEALMRVHAWR